MEILYSEIKFHLNTTRFFAVINFFHVDSRHLVCLTGYKLSSDIFQGELFLPKSFVKSGHLQLADGFVQK